MYTAGILRTQQKLVSHYYLKNKLFCRAAKTTKIYVAVEDLYLIAEGIETFKKTHIITKIIYMYLFAATILEMNALMKFQPVPFRSSMQYGDMKIDFMFSIH
jgi:hypothetical protein